MTNDKKLEPFVYYCQKVLPLVYDDSLSYYESVCKLVQKINEMVEVVNNVSIDILDQANAYTDNSIKDAIVSVEEAVKEVNKIKNELDSKYKTFENYTNSQLLLFNNRLDGYIKVIDDSIVAVNKRTDLAIEQNNEYLMGELGKNLSDVKVTNFFTGELISVQNMFNYLAMLHTTGSIYYATLIERNITYDRLAEINVSYTNLVLHGAEIIK